LVTLQSIFGTNNLAIDVPFGKKDLLPFGNQGKPAVHKGYGFG
jgi:hypothetical protein